MNTYKLKFTRLQNEIFQLLCIKSGESLNQREIANLLDVSPTAIGKALPTMEKNKLIKINRNKTINFNLIELDRDNQNTIALKRIKNLKLIQKSGLVKVLEDMFSGCIIILFGSYSFGEDTTKSDIDISIIGSKEKEINLIKYDKILERTISINFYKDLNNIHKNLRNNILNGIILSGRL
jgi:predicted nucleotidyltransferase